MTKVKKTKTTHKIWSEEENQFLLDNIAKLGYKEIATQLGRTDKSILTRLQTLNYKPQLPSIGDVVLGWKIVEIFACPKTNKTMVKINSAVGEQKERTVRMTKLVNEEIQPPKGYKKEEPVQTNEPAHMEIDMYDFL